MKEIWDDGRVATSEGDMARRESWHDRRDGQVCIMNCASLASAFLPSIYPPRGLVGLILG